ncbi:putative 3-oxoacyl-reductase protein [Umbelopsis sp. AD052]|nr:putative 3-oxoacyl-reductase protein [Umbelopsis sp. AD052]
MSTQPLQGKVAIVTGGTRGIGEAIVNILAKQGASIVINYTASEDRAKALVKTLVEAGGKAISIQADIGAVDGAKKIVDAAVKEFGKIDIVVNNAAVATFQGIEEVQLEEYDRQYNINVRGPLLLVKESTPHLQENGRIINISSVAARFGMPGSSVYAGTKGALESMSRVWAHEFGGKNITSNTINPGPVSTDMALSQSAEVLDGLNKVVQNAALKRFATVEEIATVAAFLASPGSQWVTGDVLNANGGLIFT